ncbi:hypothetical protein vseg_005368 [Gypsophila vaccaria]
MAGDGGGEEDAMQCTQHPFKSTSPGGGICALCLQDKLGKLVSSSSSFLPSSSSSSSSPPHPHPHPPSSSSSSSLHPHPHPPPPPPPHPPAPRLPFLKTNSSSLLPRSHSSTTTSSRFPSYPDFSSSTPRRRRFWSFLHLHLPLHKKSSKPHSTSAPPLTALPTSTQSVQLVVVEDDTDSSSPNSANYANLNVTASSNTTSFDRKVTRSRSVGCGSRSFSGDLFDRISTGFGDCALRRVESQREGAPRIKHRHSTSTAMRDKVRCGGLFGGFMLIASSSSSTSTTSSSYWAADAAAAAAAAARPNGPPPTQQPGMVHGRTRSWGWAFASPRRPLGGGSGGGGGGGTSTKPAAANGVTSTANGAAAGDNIHNSKMPNLDAIPSLLSART